MRLRTILASLAFFSTFALLGSFMGPGATYALWGEESNAPAVIIQPISISAMTSQVAPAQTLEPLLTLNLPTLQSSQDLNMSWDEATNRWQPSPQMAILTGGDPGDDYLNYSYVGSTFTWNAGAASALIVKQMKDGPARSWYGVAGVAKISAESTGPLSWGILAQWSPKQTTGKATVWDKSATDMFIVDSPGECDITNVTDAQAQEMLSTRNTYVDEFIPGPQFTHGMTESSQDVFVCVVQVYKPVLYTNVAVATAPDITATDTWSALLYEPELFDNSVNAPSPVLGLSITPIDPLHGPARNS